MTGFRNSSLLKFTSCQRNLFSIRVPGKLLVFRCSVFLESQSKNFITRTTAEQVFTSWLAFQTLAAKKLATVIEGVSQDRIDYRRCEWIQMFFVTDDARYGWLTVTLFNFKHQATLDCVVANPIMYHLNCKEKPSRSKSNTQSRSFWLAVLIYQLLFVGRPLFKGRIRVHANYRWANVSRNTDSLRGQTQSGGRLAPPPFTPTFDDIPSSLDYSFGKHLNAISVTYPDLLQGNGYVN